MQLKPLLACLAMESLVQLWMVSVETIAAPITGTHSQKCSLHFCLVVVSVETIAAPITGTNSQKCSLQLVSSPGNFPKARGECVVCQGILGLFLYGY
jgi:hypothetical protein